MGTFVVKEIYFTWSLFVTHRCPQRVHRLSTNPQQAPLGLRKFRQCGSAPPPIFALTTGGAKPFSVVTLMACPPHSERFRDRFTRAEQATDVAS